MTHTYTHDGVARDSTKYGYGYFVLRIGIENARSWIATEDPKVGVADLGGSNGQNGDTRVVGLFSGIPRVLIVGYADNSLHDAHLVPTLLRSLPSRRLIVSFSFQPGSAYTLPEHGLNVKRLHSYHLQPAAFLKIPSRRRLSRLPRGHPAQAF